MHRNRPHTITDEVEAQVREHIESFPAQESHYSCQDNRRCKYLPKTLSIARMYRMFLEKYEPEQEHKKPRVKEWLYRKIFNEEYNIGFGYLRSDTCEKCDMLKVGSDNATTEEERSEIQAELADHQEPLTQHFTMRKKDHKGLPVLISKAHWLNFGEGEEDGEIVCHPGEYWMRSSFSEEEAWQKINIFKGRHKVSPPTNLELPINYPHGHPINPKKVADLQTMIPYLPRSARNFYVSLKDHPVSN